MATATLWGLPPVLARAGVIPQAHPPYRPQYNGNVERLNLTLDREWAYVRSYTSN